MNKNKFWIIMKDGMRYLGGYYESKERAIAEIVDHAGDIDDVKFYIFETVAVINIKDSTLTIDDLEDKTIKPEKRKYEWHPATERPLMIKSYPYYSVYVKCKWADGTKGLGYCTKDLVWKRFRNFGLSNECIKWRYYPDWHKFYEEGSPWDDNKTKEIEETKETEEK